MARRAAPDQSLAIIADSQLSMVYSYVVARDYGFAPNPFHGVCTLATCKPEIRKRAAIGDWVLGTGSKVHNRHNCIVFAMHVTETLTFNDYWSDTRFQCKKPYLLGSKKLAFGDNIYCRRNGIWLQENSHHSLPNGKPDRSNVKHDTRVDRVLLSSDFVYWGGNGPSTPTGWRKRLIKRGPGYRTILDPAFEHVISDWLHSSGQWGYSGSPIDWSHT
jgi:hypothetical protein